MLLNVMCEYAKNRGSLAVSLWSFQLFRWQASSSSEFLDHIKWTLVSSFLTWLLVSVAITDVVRRWIKPRRGGFRDHVLYTARPQGLQNSAKQQRATVDDHFKCKWFTCISQFPKRYFCLNEVWVNNILKTDMVFVIDCESIMPTDRSTNCHDWYGDK